MGPLDKVFSSLDKDKGSSSFEVAVFHVVVSNCP